MGWLVHVVVLTTEKNVNNIHTDRRTDGSSQTGEMMMMIIIIIPFEGVGLLRRGGLSEWTPSVGLEQLARSWGSRQHHRGSAPAPSAGV